MDSSLENLKILITRPAEQAQMLGERIQNLRGNPVLFQTIVIAEIENKNLLRRIIQNLSDFDLAIFISSNAVEKTILLMREFEIQWSMKTTIAAVGTSTADTLRRFGLPITIFPQKKFNSENLLALPELQNMAGKAVIIFKGEGGRALLAATLRQRGARVTEAIVYRRLMPTYLIKPMDDIDIIICTSNIGLQNLYDMTDKKYQQQLLSKQLLVISERMVVLAKSLGFVKVPLLADNATDEAVVIALTRFAGEKKYDRTE